MAVSELLPAAEEVGGLNKEDIFKTHAVDSVF